MYRTVVACISATAMLTVCGCALFETPTDGRFRLPWASEEAVDPTVAVLPMARLETLLVARPTQDIRIRKLAWQELDESGVMAPERRRRLNDAGLRVGVAGGTVPWALQSLVRDEQENHSTTGPLSSRRDLSASPQAFMGPEFSILEGGRTIIDLQSGIDARHLPIDQIPELEGLRSRENLRCVFEVTAKELNDGWVLLSFLPQIHFGQAGIRFSVQGSMDQLPVRQDVMPLYDLQFSIKLHRGDTAVIGRMESPDWNLARLYFQPGQEDRTSQEKLLMVRLVEIDEVRGQRQTNVLMDFRD
ncbi:MAG: hypothetical protein KDA96_11995 [Planctomycetaceae bacterium]|nr:hypothetical protein [Planctomycetaceae bacterium]